MLPKVVITKVPVPARFVIDSSMVIEITFEEPNFEPEIFIFGESLELCETALTEVTGITETYYDHGAWFTNQDAAKSGNRYDGGGCIFFAPDSVDHEEFPTAFFGATCMARVAQYLNKDELQQVLAYLEYQWS